MILSPSPYRMKEDLEKLEFFSDFFDYRKSEIFNAISSFSRQSGECQLSKEEVHGIGFLAIIGATIVFGGNAMAAPPQDVVDMVTTTIDTAKALGGLAIGIFAVGLTPWGARMALQWLGSIMRGTV